MIGTSPGFFSRFDAMKVAAPRAGRNENAP